VHSAKSRAGAVEIHRLRIRLTLESLTPKLSGAARRHSASATHVDSSGSLFTPRPLERMLGRLDVSMATTVATAMSSIESTMSGAIVMVVMMAMSLASAAYPIGCIAIGRGATGLGLTPGPMGHDNRHKRDYQYDHYPSYHHGTASGMSRSV
jgi:hypothetical protein